MSAAAVVPNHEQHFEGIHCKLAVQRFPHAVMALRISGTDIGEFGEAPMRVLDGWLEESTPVQLFIDAREGRGVSISVSGEWAQWLGNRKDRFQSITMIGGSPFIHVTADFVRRFAALEGVMRICTEPKVFDQALAEAIGGN